MKNRPQYAFSLVCAFLFSFSISYGQSSKDKTIQLEVRNIPKIQHTTTKELEGHKFTVTNDKPTIRYRALNEFIYKEVALKKGQKQVSINLDQDVIFLVLRYNPNKTKEFILQRGDKAFIEYEQGKPFLDLTNRERKEYDDQIVDFLEPKRPLEPMDFYFKNRRARSKKEKKAAGEKFEKAMSSIDSLYKDNLLSKNEYEYYKNDLLYSKLVVEEDFQLEHLQKEFLHVEKFELFLRQYVFGNLKQKIISLGNGSARNSLESFDFVYASNDFSIKNKKHLLNRYLKGIKIDFSQSKYEARQKQYEVFVKKLGEEVNSVTSSKKQSINYDVLGQVRLLGTNGKETTLESILENNKGKLTYIDFWASWCAPCRKAFPSYKELTKKYEGKPIEFVFVSGDKDADKWMTAVAKEQLTKNSYLGVNYPQAEFYRDVNLKSFPRYLIFDATGKLIREKAPGPDSDNIVEILDDLIFK